MCGPCGHDHKRKGLCKGKPEVTWCTQGTVRSVVGAGGRWWELSLTGGKVLIIQSLGHQAKNLDFILRVIDSFKNLKQENAFHYRKISLPQQERG